MNARSQHLFIISIALLVGTLFCSTPAMAQEVATSPNVVPASFLSAALATGLASLGAGIAVASVGSAAIGALAEKPELLGRVLIIVGLAEGIAIYGLIVSILILNQVI